MSEYKDWYPEGEKAPGVDGAHRRDWIPPKDWNAQEGRGQTDAEKTVTVPSITTKVNAPTEDLYAASTLVSNPQLVNRVAYTCHACPEGALTFVTMKDLMDHRKAAHTVVGRTARAIGVSHDG